MTKQEAQTLLDMAQQGLAIPAEVVMTAMARSMAPLHWLKFMSQS